MFSESLHRGEAAIIDKALLQEDGVTPLPLAALSRAQVELIQGGIVAATLVYPHAELRATPGSDSSLRLEITMARSTALATGDLTFRWTVEIEDDDFAANGNVYPDIHEETLLHLI